MLGTTFTISLPPPFFWWWWWSYMMLFAYEKIIAHKYTLSCLHLGILLFIAFWLSLCRIPSDYNMLSVSWPHLQDGNSAFHHSDIHEHTHTHTHRHPRWETLSTCWYYELHISVYAMTIKVPLRGELHLPWMGEALGLITCTTKQSCFGDIWTNDMPYSLYVPPMFFLFYTFKNFKVAEVPSLNRWAIIEYKLCIDNVSYH